ncbi:MAG: hypothetical protein PHF83_07265 [Candidatus Methanomethylophilus sp.]|nr:hypothetical protein [Methanomethylophilus sp.]
MSYNVVQKVRNNYYLYEVTAFWDPAVKGSRQKRKYIGKCDKDGNLIAVTERKVFSKSFGDFYLMECMASRINLRENLMKVYGREEGTFLTAMAVTRALLTSPPTQILTEINKSFLPQMFGMDYRSQWKTLSEMLSNLEGVYIKSREEFRLFADGNRAVVFELTPFQTPFKFLDLHGVDTSYRFSRIPQANILMAYSESSEVPFYLRSTAGTRTDVPSMDVVQRDIRSFGPCGIEFYLADETIGREDLERYAAGGFNITVQISVDSTLGREGLSYDPVQNCTDTVMLDGIVFRVSEWAVQIGDHPFRYIVCLNEKRRNDEMEALYSALDQMERRLTAARWSDDLEERLDLNMDQREFLDLFDLSKAADGSVRAVKRKDRIREIEGRFGRSAFITNTARPWNELVSLSRRRDEFEYDIKIFKTDLEWGARKFPSTLSALGSMINELHSIMIRTKLEAEVKRSGLNSRYEFMDVISELSKMRVDCIDGKWVLEKASDLQKEMMAALGIELPTQSAVAEMGRTV